MFKNLIIRNYLKIKNCSPRCEAGKLKINSER